VHFFVICKQNHHLTHSNNTFFYFGDNTGIKTDPTLNKEYVAFKDPDRMQWEFYMA